MSLLDFENENFSLKIMKNQIGFYVLIALPDDDTYIEGFCGYKSLPRLA